MKSYLSWWSLRLSVFLFSQMKLARFGILTRLTPTYRYLQTTFLYGNMILLIFTEGLVLLGWSVKIIRKDLILLIFTLTLFKPVWWSYKWFRKFIQAQPRPLLSVRGNYARIVPPYSLRNVITGNTFFLEMLVF